MLYGYKYWSGKKEETVSESKRITVYFILEGIWSYTEINGSWLSCAPGGSPVKGLVSCRF